MGILENFENAWDIEFQEDHKPYQTEASPIREIDNMGRERFWEDLGRPDEPNLAVKLFSENCCSNCSCKE